MFLAESADGELVGIVVASLLTLFTGVVTPVFLSLRKQIKEQQEEIKDLTNSRNVLVAEIAEIKIELKYCHEDRKEDREWREKYEPLLIGLKEKGLIHSDDSQNESH